MEKEKLLNQIRKEFGEQSMFLLGADDAPSTDVRSSGSILLDVALGGGFGKGRPVVIQGPESAGKTTILSLAIAEAQENEPEKRCALIDLEHSYDPEWAEKLGVNLDNLFISQPDVYAEKVFDMVEYMIKTNEFSIIGLDSVPGLVPKSEMEEEDWEKESRVGGIASLMTKAMRKIVHSGLLAKSGTTLILINQLRDKIGGFSMYGTPTQTPGGRALKHASSQTLDIAKGEQFSTGQGDRRVVHGQQIKVKVSKNKIGPPFRQAVIDVYFAHGVDRLKELIDVAKLVRVLQGTSWLTFVNPETGEVQVDNEGNAIKFNGTSKAREALVGDVSDNGGELYSRIFAAVQKVIRG